MEKIQIGIPCYLKSEPYVNFLIESIIKTVSDISRIEMILGVNKLGVNKSELLKYSKEVNIKVVDAVAPEVGNRGHGYCLDKILETMTAKYGMFVDCDVAFLEKKWDEILMEKLNDNIVVVGGDTDPIHNHYKNFPSWIMMMFDVNIVKKCNISFMPANNKYVKLDENNCHLFNEKPGNTIHLDTSWELPYKLKVNNYDGIALPMLSPRLKSKNMIFMKEGMRGEEYVLNGVPIATHVGRSMTRDFYTHEVVIKWRKEVIDWLSKSD